jgi:hypothetical protein
MMAEFMKAKLAVSKNESGREGIDFMLKTERGNTHHLYLVTINIKERQSLSILKSAIGKPNEQLWVALVLLMDDINALYLIPSLQLENPDNYIFLESTFGDRLSHMSSWIIKIFPKGMYRLNEYRLANQTKNLF